MEIWKEHPSFLGSYLFSTEGRIKSVARVRVLPNGGKYHMPEKIMKTYLLDGYKLIALCNKGECFRGTVHRFVAEVFIPNPENKPCINHKNGKRDDNRVENLEWVTQSENILHAFQTGLSTQVGSNNGASKLTEKDIRRIKRMLRLGVVQRRIAEQFDVSPATITLIKKGINWGHVT